MKTLILTAIIAAAGAIPAAAQSLALPPDSTAHAPQPAPKQALYHTASESYKAERNAIRSGNKYFEDEQYHRALEAYNKALEINDASIRARFNKAVTLFHLAGEDNRGTENDPRVEAVYLLNGLLDDAKRLDTEVAEKAYYNLGNAAFNDEQYGQSIELYKSALRINPDNDRTRENLRLAQLKKQEQEQNQDQQNEDQQDQKDQQQQQEQQQQQQQQEQQQQQQQQPQPQPQQMNRSAQQILQSMQNKENATRKKVQAQEEPATGRPQTDKPW